MFSLNDLSVTTRGYILIAIGVCLTIAGFGYFATFVHRLLLISGLVVTGFGLFQSGLLQQITDFITSLTQQKS